MVRGYTARLDLPPAPVRRAGLASAGRSLPLHERPPVIDLRLVLVVGPAAQLEVLHRVHAAARPVLLVVELEEAPRSAPPPRVAHVRAPAAIAQPHRPTHRGRDDPRSRRRSSLRRLRRVLARRRGRTRAPGQRRLRRQRPLEQQRQPALDDRRRVAIRHLMRQQILQLSQCGVRLLADRDPHLVPLRSQRLDPRRRPDRGGRRRRRRARGTTTLLTGRQLRRACELTTGATGRRRRRLRALSDYVWSGGADAVKHIRPHEPFFPQTRAARIQPAGSGDGG